MPKLAAGATALYRAVSNARADVELVEMLLMSGADPNIAGEQGVAPLERGVIELTRHGQINSDRKNIIKLLITHGADVNHRDEFGRTALIVAAAKLSVDIVDYLLTVPGIDIDIQDNEGKTALTWAITYQIARPSGFAPTASYLIVLKLRDAGADPLLKSNEGKTARQYVVKSNSDHTKLLLRDSEKLWLANTKAAQRDLQEKFMIARRLRMGVDTSEGSRLELPQRQISEGIIRNSEYDNLCMGLQTNMNKPGVIALAKSLNIKTSNKTKTQLCNEIAKRLIIK